MFTEDAVILREVCNGIMFVSALELMVVCAYYIWNHHRNARWYKSLGVQVMAALIILMLGHSVRAGSSWMEFVWTHVGWDNYFWANTFGFFLAATALIITGKMLSIFIFTAPQWRWPISISAAVFAVGIPVTLALAISLW